MGINCRTDKLFFMRNIITIFFIFSLFCSFNKTEAKNDSIKNNTFGAFIIVPFEFPVIDNDYLNHKLSSFGFPQADYPIASIGFGIQLYLKRWVVVLSFNKSTKKNEEELYITETEYRSTSINLGYDLIKDKRFSIYPYIGLKGCGINYLYEERLAGNNFFDDYFLTNLSYKEITNSRMHFDIGLGISHQWFYLINFRTGFLLPLEKSRINVNNNSLELSNSPKIDYQFYFTLTLGLGGIISDNDIRQREQYLNDTPIILE